MLGPGVGVKSAGVDSGEDACADACDAEMLGGCSVSEAGGVEIRARLELGSLDKSVSVCFAGSAISMSEVSASLAESFSVSVDSRWFSSGVSWGGFRAVCCWSLFSVWSSAGGGSFLGQSRTTWSGEAHLKQSFG